MKKIFNGIWNLFDFSMNKREDLEKLVTLSNQAKQILEAEIVQKFFDDTRTFFINKILESDYSEKELREEYYRYLRILDRFKQHFELYVKAGDEAKYLLNEEIENDIC